jgi:hypothetical protein
LNKFLSLLRHGWPATPALFALALSVFPLLRGGFPMGHDWPFELVRIAEFRFAILDGQLPPFWASNLYGGLGSPIFLFYAPLYLATSCALMPFVGTVMNAATFGLVLFTIAGAALMWKLVRQLCPERPAAARIGVVLYVLHPYLLADKWIRNANAEFAALSLLPAVLVGATAREPKTAFWWTALSVAGVILAHNITALVAIGLAIVIPAFVHRKLRALVPIGAGLLAALALTAFLWVPALLFLPLIHGQDLLIGKFDFHGQFPTITSLFWSSAFYSGGWLTVPLLMVALLAPIIDTHARRIMRSFGLVTLVLIFLMLPISTWVWEHVPLLRYEQFPWRLMGPLAVLLTSGCAIATMALPRSVPLWLAEVIILIAAVLNAYPTFAAYKPMPAQLRTEVERVLTPEGIRTRNLRTTVYDEYLPAAADRHGIDSAGDTVVFHKWAFPVWSATIEGRAVPVEQCSGGLACVRAANSNAHVSLQLREPRLRTWCKAISLLALAALIAIARFVRPDRAVDLLDR